ncbi:MAG: tetratricopeptide repeat protein [Chitinophagaceae bacterium]|nr:MAG: tetratricopeptide repeat protein [Chitinophagaceae bacterium]
MRILSILILCLLPTLLHAQERGIKPTAFVRSTQSPLKGDSGKRKAALIVGISNYYSTNLQLKYARQDAELFFRYLTEVRDFPAQNVFSLPDSAATGSKIYSSISELKRWLQPGDELVIYLAGHGDVQGIDDDREAFFLGWDVSDTRNYLGNGGTLRFKDLEEHTRKLSEQKKVKVTLVMDACHSGFTQYQEGFQKAQEDALTNFGKISKMLGCAANELSFEADSVGHGLFTWYLVQGLMGMNSMNSNELSVEQLRNFVKAHVSGATRGRQNPIIIAPEDSGPIATITPAIREKALLLFRNRKYGPQLAGRGTSAAPQGQVDSLLDQYVARYNEFLSEGRLYESDSSCLGVIRILSQRKESSARELQEGLQNHLAEVLETRSQLVLNEYLKGQALLPPAQTFYRSGVEAALADSLLPAGDPRHTPDAVMALFLKANSYIRYDRFEKFDEAEALLRNALALEDRAAYIYMAIGQVKAHRLQYDSALWYARKAEELIPTWVHPKNEIGGHYMDIGHYDEAMAYFQKAIQLDSTYSWSYNNMGLVMYYVGRLAEAEKYLQQGLALKWINADKRLKRDWAIAYNNLGIIYNERGLPAQAERYFLLADSVDATFPTAQKNLGDLYAKNDGRKAEAYYKRMIDGSPYAAAGYEALGDYYRERTTVYRHQERADSLYDLAIALNPYDPDGYAGKGLIRLDRKQPDSAYAWFYRGVQAARGSDGAWYTMTSYYEHLGSKDSIRAVYARVLQLNPYRADAADEFARFLLKEKDTLAATQVLHTAIRYQPLSPQVHYFLGNLEFQSGRASAAVVSYQRSLQVDSSFTPALAALAYLELQQGNTQAALRVIGRLRRLSPYDDRVTSFLNVALEKSREIAVQQRYAWLQRLLPLDGASVDLHTALAEASYRSGRQQRPAFNGLRRAEAASQLNYPEGLTYCFLLAVELKDPSAKEYAQRYLEETLNPDPAISAVALVVTGRHSAARKEKRKTHAAALQSFGTRFRQILSAL